MKTLAAVLYGSRQGWLPGALALFLLAGCAGNPGADEPAPTESDSVDIGYGSVERDQVLGSVTTVEGNVAKDERTQTFFEMLARVAGVQVVERPGGEVTVRIRGAGSFQSSEEPLFVVDGTPMPSIAGLSGLSPSVVESITVLKDPGQTAIYGSRGANGVILVRTKGG